MDSTMKLFLLLVILTMAIVTMAAPSQLSDLTAKDTNAVLKSSLDATFQGLLDLNPNLKETGWYDICNQECNKNWCGQGDQSYCYTCVRTHTDAQVNCYWCRNQDGVNMDCDSNNAQFGQCAAQVEFCAPQSLCVSFFRHLMSL
jgi:hypothetical protein